ncbi:MAG TPA: hypothetical protein VFB76_06090, partial [Candidatus Angelobacter sp.]|nr:hypothetical protein [Candidatus Angelobacter sp.]
MMRGTFNIGGLEGLLMMGVLMLFCGRAVQAQTSSGQLTITMSVQSSISLVFKDNANVGNPGFCPLTNAGTNNVGLDLGIASHAGNFHSSTCVNYQHISGGSYEISSAFDVVVNKTNSSSPNYR